MHYLGNKQYEFVSHTQAWRQDNVTGGTEINFGGAREVYLCEFERGTGAREIYSSVDQTKKVKTKKKKRSSVQKFPQILLVIVSKFLRFFTNTLAKTKIKKKVFVQKLL